MYTFKKNYFTNIDSFKFKQSDEHKMLFVTYTRYFSIYFELEQKIRLGKYGCYFYLLI